MPCLKVDTKKWFVIWQFCGDLAIGEFAICVCSLVVFSCSCTLTCSVQIHAGAQIYASSGAE